jgi:anaerobic magnesium-protoporphyrin IX monomethyl ester cyclase
VTQTRSGYRPLRIMLADPPVQEERYIYYQPTMGILYLIGALKRAFPSTEVEVRYLQGFGGMSDHLAAIEAFRPDLYGLSFKTPMARLGHRTLRAVKERFPSLTVIAGGSHVSVMADEVMTMTAADACFRGECEKTIVQIVEAFSSPAPRFDEIPGGVTRDTGSLRTNPPAPFPRDLDSLAWPAWETVDPSRFPGLPYYKRRPYLGVLVSRGCPFRCTFCSEPVWKIFGRPTFRSRSPACIVEEVRYLYARGVREMRLWCEEFNAGSAWAIDVLRRIAELGLRDLYLNFNIRGDVMPEALADAMADANVWLVTLGFESASNRVLRGVEKHVTTEQIEHTCGMLASRRIRVTGYFQFYSAWEEDGRLCWETPEDCRETIRWARRLGNRGLLHYMYTSIATPRPGTPLWSLAVRHGLLREPDRPFGYLAEGMRLPGVRAGHVRATVMRAEYEKARLAARNGQLNLPVIVRRAGRKLLRLPTRSLRV